MECYTLGGVLMRKLFITALAALCLAGCSVSPECETVIRIVPGHYYTVGEVITEDGNIWEYNGEVMFDNNGTPDDIYDDIIVGLGR
jgi:hypothetical protein